jgi:hypothetical protein
MTIILLLFASHWVLSCFFQSFFHHRYASHRMFTMTPRVERTFHVLTYLVQGSSYLSPRAYACSTGSTTRTATRSGIRTLPGTSATSSP